MSAPALPTLTLWQPYATLFALGVKGPETRDWQTKHRGRIGIAAAKVPQPEEPALVAFPAIHDALWPHLGFDRRPMPTSVRERLPRGVLVATAELVDCVPIIEYDDPSPEGAHILYVDPYLWIQHADGSHDRIDDRQRFFGDYRSGRWAWLFEDVKPTTDRCPWCWGSGATGQARCGDVYHRCTGACFICPTCEGRGKCDPVPVRGMPGIWNWTPA